MFNKRDLVLLGDFIDDKNPKIELNYAQVGHGGLFATDTRKAIRFHQSDLVADDILVHKKLLKGFVSTMSKDDLADVDGESISCGGVEMNLDTAKFNYHYPDSERILDKTLPKHFKLSGLEDILFELSEKFCFIDSFHLEPLIKHGDASWYDVFYSPMTEEDMGMVKIVATRVEDEKEKVLYTAVIMGREFKSKAKE